MINVSLSGAFVQTALKAPLLSRVQLSVAAAPGRSLAMTQIEGQIVRQTEAGLALEWSEFGGDRIQALLAQLSSGDLSWVNVPKKRLPRKVREKRS
jgi:hypothetical protein